jgi:hypothetical protein
LDDIISLDYASQKSFPLLSMTSKSIVAMDKQQEKAPSNLSFDFMGLS